MPDFTLTLSCGLIQLMPGLNYIFKKYELIHTMRSKITTTTNVKQKF